MSMRLYLPMVLSVLSLAPAGLASPKTQGAVQALYPTQAEAEKAAKHFGCSGAHRMGDQWMPCASHNPKQGTAAGADHGSH
jgi:hypothetical protein